MSYLLTEIALEMLGYKFFDCTGVIGPTNFQGNAPDAKNLEHSEDAAESSTLQNVLGIKRKSLTVDDTNVAPKPKFNRIHVPKTAHTGSDLTTKITPAVGIPPSTPKTYTPVIVATLAPPRRPTATSGTPTLTTAAKPIVNTAGPPGIATTALLIVTTPSAATELAQSNAAKQSVPAALAKLLNQEYEKARREMINFKLHYISTNPILAKRVEPRNINTPNDFVQSYIAAERKYLQKEAQIVHEFLQMAETKLITLNKQPYELYKRTFREDKLELFNQQHRQMTNNLE